MRNKKALKEIAKNTLLKSLSIAYYQISDNAQDLTEEEENYIIEAINKYGSTMAKSIGKEYYTQ